MCADFYTGSTVAQSVQRAGPYAAVYTKCVAYWPLYSRVYKVSSVHSDPYTAVCTQCVACWTVYIIVHTVCSVLAFIQQCTHRMSCADPHTAVSTHSASSSWTAGVLVETTTSVSSRILIFLPAPKHSGLISDFSLRRMHLVSLVKTLKQCSRNCSFFRMFNTVNYKIYYWQIFFYQFKKMFPFNIGLTLNVKTTQRHDIATQHT